MADSAQIKLEGLAAIEFALENTPKQLHRNVWRKILRRAARPVIEASRRRVMAYSSTVARSITINKWNSDNMGVLVGPKRSKKRDPWYAHFVEFGVSGIGRFKKKGKVRYRPDQPARPFMRPAFDETKDVVQDVISTDVANIVADFWLKSTPQ